MACVCGHPEEDHLGSSGSCEADDCDCGGFEDDDDETDDGETDDDDDDLAESDDEDDDDDDDGPDED